MVRRPKMKLNLMKVFSTEKWSSYLLRVDDESVHVTVTQTPDMVRYWISTLLCFNYDKKEKLVIGLRFQWTLNDTNEQGVSVLQLCVRQYCLVFQIRCASYIPQDLLNFLNYEHYVYVGVGIHRYAEILNRDYGIILGPTIVELQELYAIRRGESPVTGIDNPLRELIILVLKKDYKRPLSLFSSNWDALQLVPEQIMYASADSYCIYCIAILLKAWNCKPQN